MTLRRSVSSPGVDAVTRTDEFSAVTDADDIGLIENVDPNKNATDQRAHRVNNELCGQL